jgi:hypothetical protein
MRGIAIDDRTAAISELVTAADDFAQHAQQQETCRDRARPGTGVFHQHAHSATLWRQAEERLRSQARELELSSGGWSSAWDFSD